MLFGVLGCSFYLFFVPLERYFEKIEAFLHARDRWSDAEVLVQIGSIYRDNGFTAHPKYLEVARAMGITNVWEERGPPDFCRKVQERWVCE